MRSADIILRMNRKELLKKIRVANLSYWADFQGRQALGKKVGDDDCNHLNQLLNGHGSFGDRVAEKYETALNLPPLWLDVPHINLWSPTYRDELLPYLSPLELSGSLLDTANDRDKRSIKEVLETALSLLADRNAQ